MTRDELLGEIAIALQQHFTEGAHYYDKTDDRVVFLLDEELDEELGPEDFPYWEKEGFEIARTHDLIPIEPVESWKGYSIMEDFASQCGNEKIQSQLFQALNRKHPFSKFRYAVEVNGVLDDWYAFKDAAYRKLAEEWLEDNHLPF